MPRSNHQKLPSDLLHHNHAAELLRKIARVEEDIAELSHHTLVWEDDAKRLKKLKLHLRDELAQLAKNVH